MHELVFYPTPGRDVPKGLTALYLPCPSSIRYQPPHSCPLRTTTTRPIEIIKHRRQEKPVYAPSHASSAVNAKHLAVDPLTVLRREEADDARDVDGQTHAVEGRPASGVLRRSAEFGCGTENKRTSSTPSLSSLSPLGMYSLQTAWYMSVLMPPGAMALTVIFLSPKSEGS